MRTAILAHLKQYVMQNYFLPFVIFFLSLCHFVNGQMNKVPVYTITSFQEPQPGEEPIFAIDDDESTVYHSLWGQVGIPDTLDVYFTDRVQSINSLLYKPRQSGLNGIWTRVNVFYQTRDSDGEFLPFSGNPYVWPANNEDKTIQLDEDIIQPTIIRFAVEAGFGDFSSCAELHFYSNDDILPADMIDCEVSTESLVSDSDQDLKAQILLQGSFASSFQPGENIERSFDGDLNTLYHSSYNNTIFPVVLNYRLDGAAEVDYMVYTPRSFGSNGNFGKVEIKYNTSEAGPGSEFIHLTDFDFGQSGLPTRVDFPFPVTPLNIQILVQDGAGNFASCAQMEFFSRMGDSNNDLPYSDIFADALYAGLRSGITQTDIDTIGHDFYRTLAQCLLDETYNHRYRVQPYEVYPRLSTIRDELKVANYNAFENPTGIVFSEGGRVALFARNIPIGVSVYLRVRDFANEDDPEDRAYQINNGLNVIDMQNSGLGYISYYDDDPNLENIEINIVSGKVNGYFDLDRSEEIEWTSLLSGENYSKLDVIGKYTHLIYDKGALKFGSPFNGHELISAYDTIVAHERLLMGLYKYDRNIKNRQLSISGFSGGWYAGGLGIHLDLSWGVNSVTNPKSLGLWGIAHEFGHVNQIRPGIRWHGTIEVTTNIYSTWVTYHMNPSGNKYTRLESDAERAHPDLAPEAGGRINGLINATTVRGEPLKGAEDYDVFKVLVPFWQLQLYYQLGGAARNAPILSLEDRDDEYEGVDYANYFGTVAEMVRNADLTGMSDGELQLNYVKMTCDAVQEDLTDFFRNTGFLRPIETVIDDYGERPFLITQAQVDEVIDYIQSKGYDKPVSPVIHYMSAHSLEAFKNQLGLEGENGEGVSLQDSYLTIDHSIWKNVVAFETLDSEGNLIHVSIVGTGDPSNQSSRVYFPEEGVEVYAVGFDGERSLVYPKITTGVSNVTDASATLTIYPNPILSNSNVRFEIPGESGVVELTMHSQEGTQVYAGKGTLEELSGQVQGRLTHLKPGVYLVLITQTGGREWQGRLVVQ